VIAKHARAVVATDYAGAMVEQLRRRMSTSVLTNVDCRQADLYALDLEPASFDVVVTANVLHLLPDLPAAIAVLRDMLKPHGLLLAPTYCHDQTWGSRCVSRLLALTGFPGQRRFTMDSLTQAMEREALHVSRRELVAGIIPIAYVEARRV
jgi:phosphatidylethanolamine/phosphatidyl-N-methylethanolamine N-methyltransferase